MNEYNNMNQKIINGSGYQMSSPVDNNLPIQQTTLIQPIPIFFAQVPNKQFVYNLQEATQIINKGRTMTTSDMNGISYKNVVVGECSTKQYRFWISEVELKTMALRGQIDCRISGDTFLFSYEDLQLLKNDVDKREENSNTIANWIVFVFALLVVVFVAELILKLI